MVHDQVWLGMDGGGTRLIALAVTGDGQVQQRIEVGPTNVRLLRDEELEERFHQVARKISRPCGIGVGLAGLMTVDDGSRVSSALQRVWPGVPAAITHDLETAWRASDDGERLPKTGTPFAGRVIILSGTGSCCYGRRNEDGNEPGAGSSSVANRSPWVAPLLEGRSAKVGGWGHQLGDRGSGYALVEQGLRDSVSQLDRTGRWGRLGSRILARLTLNEPGDMIGWAQKATKTEFAALAPEVFAAAEEGDPAAHNSIELARHHLVADALACGHQLMKFSNERIDFVMSGSVLLAQPEFAASIGREILRALPGSRSRNLEREAAWGGIQLARQISGHPSKPFRAIRPARPQADRLVLWPKASGESPTEQLDPRFSGLDQMPLHQALELWVEEEGRVADAVKSQIRRLERLVRDATRILGKGGRLIYVGAGTSGRLGVLDASECPPTFCTPPDLIQGVIAGGCPALHSAVEGAEDDVPGGAEAVAGRGVTDRDLVVGIAASGRTPFVWGALDEARQRNATTALICCCPGLRFARGSRPNHVIELPTGPEILAGSTRLKAASATKVVLNALTTLVMVRLGKVAGNLMIDLNPSNQKLRHRAAVIVTCLTGVSLEEARAALEASNWDVPGAAKQLGWKPKRGAPSEGVTRRG